MGKAQSVTDIEVFAFLKLQSLKKYTALVTIYSI